MDRNELTTILKSETLKDKLSDALANVGIKTVEGLRDDDKVRKAAQFIYGRLPLIPVRLAVKAVIGRNGFESLVFLIRDQMLAAGSMDLSFLSPEHLKDMIKSYRK